jgi:hypothetical protein
MTDNGLNIKINSTLLVGIFNAFLVVAGFAANYIITTTRLEDAVVNAGSNAAHLRLELDQIKAREQTIVDSAVVDRSATAVTLATIERDIKYIEQTLEEIKKQQSQINGNVPR